MAVCWAAVPAAGETVEVRGVKVDVDPPAGFVDSDDFPGFVHPGKQASITIAEFPVPIARTMRLLSSEAVAGPGMTLLRRETARFGDRDGTIFTALQTSDNISIRKWTVVLGDEGQTVIVSAVCPETADDRLVRDLRRALLSVRWSPTTADDRLDGLAFRISETDSLRIALRVASSVVLTRDGTMGPAGPNAPTMVVGGPFDDGPTDDLVALSRHLLKKRRSPTDVTNIRGRALSVAGLAAYEIVADGTEPPRRIYQLVLSDGRGYFLVEGEVGVAEGDAYLPRFRLVGESLIRVR